MSRQISINKEQIYEEIKKLVAEGKTVSITVNRSAILLTVSDLLRSFFKKTKRVLPFAVRSILSILSVPVESFFDVLPKKKKVFDPLP